MRIHAGLEAAMAPIAEDTVTTSMVMTMEYRPCQRCLGPMHQTPLVMLRMGSGVCRLCFLEIILENGYSQQC